MWWRRKEEPVVTKEPQPELDRVRQLAQRAAELGAQVERELRTHITEGHPNGT